MGIAPYLCAAAVNGVLAQRLVKRLCPKCKKLQKLTDDQKRILTDNTIDSAYFPVGCSFCNYTGYSGRFAIHEVLELDTELRTMITRNAGTEEIHDYAVKHGMKFMDQNIRDRIREGDTTIEEYVRTVFTIA